MTKVETKLDIAIEKIDDLAEGNVELVELIKGNGKPGLNERVRILEAKEKRSRSIAGRWWQIAVLVIAAGIGIMQAVVAAHILP